MTLAEVTAVFDGSNGDATRALYARLEALGPLGVVAVNAFRATKTSGRAKVYRRGPGHKTAAYERKDWSIGNMAAALAALPEPPFRWGWAVDEALRAAGDPHHHVIYLDLPTGQISYHVGRRADGPDYPGEWDQAAGAGPSRVCRWCAQLLLHQSEGGEDHGREQAT